MEIILWNYVIIHVEFSILFILSNYLWSCSFDRFLEGRIICLKKMSNFVFSYNFIEIQLAYNIVQV